MSLVRPRRLIVTAAVLAAAWLAWSGHYTPLLLAFGFVSCALVVWLAARTGFFDGDVYSLYLGPGLPRYWTRLLADIVRANAVVARIVVSRHPAVSPTFTTVDASALSPVAQTIVVNSITLTPGTVSLNVEDGRIEVHCLTRAMAEALAGGGVVERVARLAGEGR
ncbi:MAG TPA: Na+/H+ antiporter subunit E [Gammaproteobacteria bacterium]|nr:Na+/H+ antiporter subunit E [Gammaproteobacteria bacterium]